MTLVSVPSPRTFNIKTRKSTRFHWHPHSTMERDFKANVENIDWLHYRLRNWVYSLLQQSIFPPHSNLCSSLLFQICYLTFSNLNLLSRASNPASFQEVPYGGNEATNNPLESFQDNFKVKTSELQMKKKNLI